MVPRPGRADRRPGSEEDLVGPVAENPGRLTHDCLRVVDVDFPATGVRDLGQLLAVHDGVGPRLVWRATLDGDVVGEVERPGSK